MVYPNDRIRIRIRIVFVSFTTNTIAIVLVIPEPCRNILIIIVPCLYIVRDPFEVLAFVLLEFHGRRRCCCWTLLMMLLLVLRCRCILFTIPSVSIPVLLFFSSCCLLLLLVLLFLQPLLENKYSWSPAGSIRPYLSIRLFDASSRIFSSLSLSLIRVLLLPPLSELVHVLLLPPPSTVSIYSSLNRVVPDLFVSFYVPFRSCFSLHVVLVLLRPPTPTDDTPIPSSDRGIDI